MYLLTALESRLGSVDTWPSYILRFLFVDLPNAATIRRVAGFFYGNGVEYYLAAEFYGLCSPSAGIAVKEHVHWLYLHWQRSPGKRRVAYYDVAARRHLYLNGWSLFLHPATLALGPVGTGFGQHIYRRLEQIRNVVAPPAPIQ